MTKECTTCGQRLDHPCCDLPNSLYSQMRERDCLLRQRDSLAAQTQHLKSHMSWMETQFKQQQTAESKPTDSWVSTLLNSAANVLSKISLLDGPPSASLLSWLVDIQHTDYNLSVAVAWDIQMAILDATTDAYVQYSPSGSKSGPTSQSVKVSPNPTAAPGDDALDDAIGAAAEFDDDLVDAVREATDDAFDDLDGFNPRAFIRSLNRLGYIIIPPIEGPQWTLDKKTGRWKWRDEYTIIPRNNHTTFECRHLDSCATIWNVISLHRDLQSAKSDCETHYLASKGQPS